MARFSEDGKVTTIMDGQEVETLDWNNEEDRKKIGVLLDQGRWADSNKDKIKGWRKDAEELEANRDKVQMALGFARRLDGLRNGTEDTEKFITDLKNEGIDLKLTKSDLDDLDDGDTDPVTRKLMEKIESLEKKIETSSLNTEAETWKLHSSAAHKDLASKFSGKNGYPKYNAAEIDDYLVKNGGNSIFHPDVNKQYELIYQDLNREKILEAERTYGGLSEPERLKKIKEAQGVRGGGGDIQPGSFKSEGMDRDYDKSAQSALDSARASGKSFTIED